MARFKALAKGETGIPSSEIIRTLKAHSKRLVNRYLGNYDTGPVARVHGGTGYGLLNG